MADNNDFFSTNVEIFGKIVIYKSLKFYWIGPKSAAAIITPFINLTLFWSLQIRQKGKIVFYIMSAVEFEPEIGHLRGEYADHQTVLQSTYIK